MNLDMFKTSDVHLTEEEEHFLKETRAQGRNSPQAHSLSRVMIEMYSIKHAKKNTKALINSNKDLADSTNKHATAMRRLTTALVIVGSLAVVATIIAAIIIR
ncbi:MAG: hypothetical protein E2O79_06250 [Caldithrix sp.]|nr:MAG: hypothetical protein E2O79_06250 [Caldithrix sp.]